MRDGLSDSFDYLDKDNSTYLTKKEIFDALFQTIDTNGDGVWNSTEVKDFLQEYAKLLHRNMKDGWESEVDKAIAEINNGVSAHELEAALSADGHIKIDTFKNFIMDNSKPLPAEKLDAWEIIEEIMLAMGDDNHTEFNEEMFVEIVKDYFIHKYHPWNNTISQKVVEWFHHMNTNNDS